MKHRTETRCKRCGGWLLIDGEQIRDAYFEDGETGYVHRDYAGVDIDRTDECTTLWAHCGDCREYYD